jgi:hypothetical protein
LTSTLLPNNPGIGFVGTVGKNGTDVVTWVMFVQQHLLLHTVKLVTIVFVNWKQKQ